MKNIVSMRNNPIHIFFKKYLFCSNISGGDIVNNDGTGSISIYGEYFDDETFEIKPDSAGLLVMANKGKIISHLWY